MEVQVGGEHIFTNSKCIADAVVAAGGLEVSAVGEAIGEQLRADEIAEAIKYDTYVKMSSDH